jgi:hypothetical protein
MPCACVSAYVVPSVGKQASVICTRRSASCSMIARTPPLTDISFAGLTTLTHDRVYVQVVQAVRQWGTFSSKSAPACLRFDWLYARASRGSSVNTSATLIWMRFLFADSCPLRRYALRLCLVQRNNTNVYYEIVSVNNTQYTHKRQERALAGPTWRRLRCESNAMLTR